ncbi:MAG: glutathione peroxidase [Gammaproteobacteria bacterium]|nr:MAG: glutathione peroxidase [Gammaproteobacteria bacterium]
MKIISILLLLTIAPGISLGETSSNCPPLLDFSLRKLGGEEQVHLCEAYRGKVLLVVNTASRCAFTDQYEGLERLYREKADEGLVVLGFPSNDFGNQEPGEEQKIKQFCKLTYGVRFPMFEKVHVRGDDTHPFYKALIEAADSRPKWNFHKYLIGRDGRLIDDFWSGTEPDSSALRAAIDEALAQ